MTTLTVLTLAWNCKLFGNAQVNTTGHVPFCFCIYIVYVLHIKLVGEHCSVCSIYKEVFCCLSV